MTNAETTVLRNIAIARILAFDAAIRAIHDCGNTAGLLALQNLRESAANELRTIGT